MMNWHRLHQPTYTNLEFIFHWLAVRSTSSVSVSDRCPAVSAGSFPENQKLSLPLYTSLDSSKLEARSSKLEAIMLILVVCFNYGTFLQWNSYCWQAHHRKWTGTGNVLKSRCGLCFSPAMNWSIVTAELPFGKLLEWAYDNWSDCLAQTHRLSEIGSISVGLVQDGLLGSSWNIVCSQAFGVLRSMNWSDS